ncbi:MAG TPA: YIP1 family protein, partial [Myxococcaceae bacterium]|nr:YIP1 family protein [Myxococcaceae bacterium]
FARSSAPLRVFEMQAQCPNCQNLFTTDRMGLQFCPSCGRQVSVAAEAPQAPPAAVTLTREETPWERRAQNGVVPGYFETWRQVMFSPDPFWRRLRPDGPWPDALFFGWITAALAGLLQLPFQFFSFNAQLQNILLRSNRDHSRTSEWMRQIAEAMQQAGGAAVAIGSYVGTTLFIPVALFISAAVLHGTCLLLGTGGKGFWASFRVVAYASAPALLGWIPCVGGFVFLYALVLEILGVARVHETSLEKAAAAVLLPLLLICCCVAGLIAAVAGGIVGAASGR